MCVNQIHYIGFANAFEFRSDCSETTGKEKKS